MKNILNIFIQSSRFIKTLTIYCSLFHLTSCKKEFKATVDNHLFQYEVYGMTNVFDLIQCTTGDIYILGSIYSQTVLTKTTSDGTFIWQKNYRLNNWEGGISLHEKPDGTILIMGSTPVDTGLSTGDDINILKLNPDGTIIKNVHYSALKRDTVTSGGDYYNYYPNFYTPDGSGGYFFVITTSPFLGPVDVCIIHYTSNDSIDRKVSLTNANPFYPYDFVGMRTNTAGNLILNYYRDADSTIYAEKLDKSEFNLNNIKYTWRIPFKPLYQNFDMVGDNNFLYQYGLKLSSTGLYTEGVEIIKIDVASGTVVKRWTIPLSHATGFNSAQVGSKMLIDGNSLYIPVLVGNDIYVLKSSTDGADIWQTQVGGSVSRENLFVMRMAGNDIILIGTSTNNRSPYPNIFMCRLDKNGKLVSK